jgi:Na+-translocating ferredoxin:NAD+ oxidoreductase subunit D
MSPLSMASSATPAAAPHVPSKASVSRTMFLVQAALVPATLYGFWLYGWPAIFLFLLTVGACVFWEALCIRLAGRLTKPQLTDGSAILTGWLLAMTLPPWAPWWVAVVGGLLAIVFGKQVFGGLGQNPFNPAMVARVALLVSFPVPLTLWVTPLPITSADAPGFHQALLITLGAAPIPDAVTSASLLGYAKTELSRGLDLVHALGSSHAPNISYIGERAGSLGETGSVLIACGGLALLILGVITWEIPLAMLLGLAIPALIGHSINPARFMDAGSHLLSGGAMLGAFFIATDYVTSPSTSKGKLIFGFGCGFITYVIRTWGGYPEGVAFAVLLMNTLTPVIDRVTKPRILGRDKQGHPLQLKD